MQRTLTVIHALGLLLAVFSAAYLLPIVTAVISPTTPYCGFPGGDGLTLSIGF
jgi:hypothetical protein